MLKDPTDIPLDFSRFMKKIHEIEDAKAILPPISDLKEEETAGKRYIRRYDDRAVNRIYYNRGTK